MDHQRCGTDRIGLAMKALTQCFLLLMAINLLALTESARGQAPDNAAQSVFCTLTRHPKSSGAMRPRHVMLPIIPTSRPGRFSVMAAVACSGSPARHPHISQPLARRRNLARIFSPRRSGSGNPAETVSRGLLRLPMTHPWACRNLTSLLQNYRRACGNFLPG
jgi:hypothetical protein